jgi:hypothetical protein
MSYTTTQWGTRALQKASIVAEDDTPTAAQLAWAVAVGTALFHECVSQNVRFPGGSYAALPDEYYDAFPSLVAYALESEVGLMSKADAEAAKALAKSNIRAINGMQPLTVRADDSKASRAGFNFTTGL